ncbi:FAD-binding oxidoreductase [Bosea sp. SSUT16]|uniref:FAD-binding oxidoreductase n=1 Tax=Bosea spartocytisi TaxID=2773451 RepID=A0A927I124_9HYPH|nr:FAD-binding oxidoreductase [Bosea spartocytisi]MBD3846013.1 FAD-binding oxidoreductase [Bosea spartocytisi]MCT4473197.1 FAD-binding oxidoreductase [Bosea spartocytisi]
MIERLRGIVGDKGLITDPAEMEPWLVDWRQRRRGRALAIVQPASTAEVSAVVALCAAEGQPVFPVGGNTGLCFGAVPDSGRSDKPGIVLSLRRMNRIRSVDRATGVATVDAGVVLGDLHNAAIEAGRQFPLHLGSEGSAQIGGLISTNAGGTGVVRYGPMRDLVAGLEVVLPDGRVLSDLAALRKDNTGYMLRHLFIGAEGTLGIVTGAALRLHPQTPNTAHAWVAVAEPAAAVALLAALQDRAGSYIQAFEMVSASQFELVRKHAERARFPFPEIPAWSVLIELGSEDATTALPAILEEVVGAALEAGEVLDAVIATSEQQAAEFWHLRHSVSEANRKEGMSITHDVAVRSSHVAPFIAAADKVAAERYPQAITEVVCHLGDGNVHYILMFTHEFWAALPDAEAFALEVERAIHDVAARFGGTFSAEHGVGRKLTEELARLADPLRYELMNKVKTLFDPQNLMNPGVLLAPGTA